ncbi:MAG TPA: hypothetical protein VJ719_01015 [Chthoniobacterales bacterium]|nr:hypothetical protein [Chthoniobacterales bacterium]
MNRAIFWRAVSLLLALTTVAGLAPAATEKRIFEETLEKIYPVQATAKFRLKNGDGSVWIYGADVSEMKVRAVKKSYRQDRLAQIAVNIVVRPDAITIDTDFPSKPKWGWADRSGTVDYVIILPWFCDIEKVQLDVGELFVEGMRGPRVNAELGSGRMFGHNCFSNVRFSLGTGGLEVLYGWWEPHDIAVHAQIANGNSWILIPAAAEFRLHAETRNGSVVTDFSDKRSPENKAKLDLAVGEQPNAEMKIQTMNGNITVREINR